MVDLIALSLFAWLNIWGQPQNELKPLEFFPWHKTAIFMIPEIKQDAVSEDIVRAYLEDLDKRNIINNSQGVWIQSGWNTLATKQGKMPLPAASLTKIATTLAALDKWGSKHQFATNIYSTGKIERGVVTGDLIVEGNGDPLFVWEEAIALGNALNELGIRKIEGDLLITDRFYMNYQHNSKKAGELLKQGLDFNLWQSEITKQYLQMPAGTPQPEIAIARQVQSIKDIPASARLLITHQSLPLGEVLRQMNIYSNNKMAQMLADSLGGAKEVAKSSADIANFPPEEIELINGSGLGEANRISPRAVCQMLMAIDRLLKNDSLAATDLFPTAGRDLVGTVQNRSLPTGTTVKTGTLDNVSALAGVIPTKDKGNVYFSIINYGRQYQYFRQQQDWLLNELVAGWELMPHDFGLANNQDWFLGDPRRNVVVR
ncbi:D-alanyl-D-alanine carboxypeptidase [Waterburya agarophytonicola K14]|uniref:D-alanyl-D-alanine carboxypeptidase n=1 Tax=Waterburya agarophytonicola KI4 TaxID=2874699 RepID=A0A964FEE5_9CYAN|nr:D-alanyl-D-alanine carboxypeptidase [Waterburya agarophytonicola]MCC0175782.1 D-alanyl-D-alanine carboxypeptidase [Waterburya agarophytonicola KI4]